MSSELIDAAAPVQRRYHFHWPGVTYVIVTLFMAVGALNSQNNLLFAALGVSMGGLLVSGVISGWSLMGLRLTRESAGTATMGRPAALGYTLHNVNRWMPALALHVEEVRPRSGPGWGGFFTGAHAFVAFIAPRGRARGEALVVPLRRGEARLLAVRVWSTFPFGLAKKSMLFEVPGTLLVHPPDLRLKPELLRSVAVRSRMGSGEEPSAGQGEEFFGLREYASGDNPRRIAWKPTARTGAMLVKQHSTPAPARLWVVLRLGPRASAGDERAIALAASVLREAERAAIAVGLAVPLARRLQPPRLDRRHVDRLLTDLARLDLTTLAAARARGDEPFPAPATRGACLVVDAGSGPAGGAWRHGKHVRAEHLAELAAGDAQTQRLVALLAGEEA